MTTEEKTKDKADESPAKEVAVENKAEEKAEAKKDDTTEQTKKKAAAPKSSTPKNDEPEDKTEQADESKADATPEKEESPFLVKFSIEISKEEIENGFNEALNSYVSDIKLPGFRKGKVPVEVIKSRYQEAITHEVIDKMVQEAVFKKIEKDKIKIISQPEVSHMDHSPGEDLKAEIKVEAFPDFQLPNFDELEAEMTADELKAEPFDEAKQIDAILDGHRRQAPVVSREIKDGDYVMLKFQSKILQTKKMTPKTSTNFQVEEKGHSEILDLYKDIVGKKLDDEFTLSRTYPADYTKKAWAGKDLEHYIKIESIFEMVKPEFNDEFLKTIGFENEESFKTELKTEYQNYFDKNLEEIKLKQVIDTVSDAVDVPMPEAMVNQEIGRMLSKGRPPKMNLSDKESIARYMAEVKKDAERSLKFSYILERIVEEHKIEVTSEDLEEEYKIIALQNNASVKDVRKYYMQKENAKQLRVVVTNKKVMDFLKEKVKIKEV